ncbi:MAG: biotin carboxylase N-terminal domain-containing protein, partial [Myxococcota bacterium]|nr:biotin carboxylase N-terminal domain-containing protein [Myxococcota bacterium]
MFRRVLIANRGEVAARVARTCRRLGIETVAVISTVDRGLSWLEDADKVVCIGGPRSYLDADAILDVAHAEGVSAIHPGWGFLAENGTFAARAEAIGVSFIGPSPSLLRSMGDKVTARQTMKALGVEVIPGSEGALSGPQEALELAEQIGYPVLLKAVSGGGGRGMRRVYSAEEVTPAFEEARAEALSAFGDGSMYLEKLIEQGRHIEFQVLGDRSGRVVVLGDRE